MCAVQRKREQGWGGILGGQRGTSRRGAGDGMGEAHLKMVGLRWQARRNVGWEMARAKATSRWLPREGGLEVAGSRRCGARDGVGEACLEMVAGEGR